MSSCPITDVTPTASSSSHSAGSGRTQPRSAGTAAIAAPAAQNAAKISHDPSVLRTSRMVATAAPDSTADNTPTSSQRSKLSAPAAPPGEVPTITITTPTVVSASAPSVRAVIASPRNSAA